MPYFAFGATVTGAPAWPLSAGEVGVADGELAAELAGEEDEAAELMPAGTAVASVPSRTCT